MSDIDLVGSVARPRTTRFTMSNFIVGTFAILTTVVGLICVGGLVGAVYQWVSYGAILDVSSQMSGGLAAGLLYCSGFLYRRRYTIPAYLGGAHRPSRIFVVWNAAFLSLFVIAFLTQTTVSLSRAMVVAFYGCGLITLIGLESAIRSAIAHFLDTGVIQPRHVMLIGDRAAMTGFTRRLAADVPHTERMGVRIVATADVGQNAPPDVLAEAIATARVLLPDEIVILTPWDNAALVEAVVGAFELLPVAIHLDGGPVLARYSDPHMRRVGGLATVSIAELPLSPAQVIVKRAFDIVGSLFGLILLAPVFAIIALLIKREQRDSVMFIQDRHGFNQNTFKIYKFRTMTASDNGAVVQQARPDDLRITKIGKILRRTSLDELPQLINVLKGDMSLVGPRPHAVAHDLDYGQRITRYPRRLNIKPGMTGWAQVNGYRGLTDTDEKMRRRVECDLYYIDNWSIWFDVFIIVLTVMSPRTFNNAG
jgi:polysaccharide biosynthesis protein PslA